MWFELKKRNLWLLVHLNFGLWTMDYGLWPSYVPRALIVQQQLDISLLFHCAFLIVPHIMPVGGDKWLSMSESLKHSLNQFIQNAELFRNENKWLGPLWLSHWFIHWMNQFIKVLRHTMVSSILTLFRPVFIEKNETSEQKWRKVTDNIVSNMQVTQ